MSTKKTVNSSIKKNIKNIDFLIKELAEDYKRETLKWM